MARYDFEIIGSFEAIETIARGTSVRIRHFLNQTYGRGDWRNGIGRVLQKVIREID